MVDFKEVTSNLQLLDYVALFTKLSSQRYVSYSFHGLNFPFALKKSIFELSFHFTDLRLICTCFKPGSWSINEREGEKMKQRKERVDNKASYSECVVHKSRSPFLSFPFLSTSPSLTLSLSLPFVY